MIIYRTVKGRAQETETCGFDLTIGDARKRGKYEKFRGEKNDEVYIDQIVFDPSRKNVVDLLNGDDVTTELTPKRSWMVTNRGGLAEVDP